MRKRGNPVDWPPSPAASTSNKAEAVRLSVVGTARPSGVAGWGFVEGFIGLLRRVG